MSAAAEAMPAVTVPPVTVAIASRAGLRPAWQQLIGAARAMGWPVRVTSRWVYRLPGAEPGNWNAEWREMIAEAAAAQVLLARVCDEDEPGIVAAQIGAALGAHRQVILLGSNRLLERLTVDALVRVWPGGTAIDALKDELQRRGRLS